MSFHIPMSPNQHKQMSLSYVAVSTMTLIFFEFIQWKPTQVSDLKRFYRRQKVQKGAMSLPFPVLLVSLSDFIGAFYSLMAD